MKCGIHSTTPNAWAKQAVVPAIQPFPSTTSDGEAILIDEATGAVTFFSCVCIDRWSGPDCKTPPPPPSRRLLDATSRKPLEAVSPAAGVPLKFILQTLSGFWGFAKLQESNRIAEIAYSKLHRFIAVELTLPRAERVAPRDMLKFCRDTIERLAETSPLVPDAIVKEFQAKFSATYADVAIPDRANGLRRITVNSKPVPEVNALDSPPAAGEVPGVPIRITVANAPGN